MPERTDSLIATCGRALDALLAGLPPRRRLVVAFSGGVDSAWLLHAVHRPAGGRLPVVALHVHHGLSPHADDWARFAVESAAALGVPCEVLRVRVDRNAASREAAAREARHAAFAAALRPGDALLLAHHADDQAETMLLRLLRGSGVDGLAAMRPVRPVAGVDDAFLLRPLLAVSRARIVTSARSAGLAWIEDESNDDLAIDRNFVRHEVMPVLVSRWPGAVDVLASTARRLDGEAGLLQAYLDRELDAWLSDGEGNRCPGLPTLPVDRLLSLAPAARRALLRRWLSRIGAPRFHEAWLEEVDALASSRHDAEGVLRVAGWEVHRFRGALHAFPQLPPVEASRTWAWDLVGRCDLGPGHGVLEVVTGEEAGPALALPWPSGTPVTIGLRQGGERIRAIRAGEARDRNSVAGRSPHARSLKKWLQELGIPPWLRERLPLLRVDGELVAVADRLLAVAPATGTSAGEVFIAWRPPVAERAN